MRSGFTKNIQSNECVNGATNHIVSMITLRLRKSFLRTYVSGCSRCIFEMAWYHSANNMYPQPRGDPSPRPRIKFIHIYVPHGCVTWPG